MALEGEFILVKRYIEIHAKESSESPEKVYTKKNEVQMSRHFAQNICL